MRIVDSHFSERLAPSPKFHALGYLAGSRVHPEIPKSVLRFIDTFSLSDETIDDVFMTTDLLEPSPDGNYILYSAMDNSLRALKLSELLGSGASQ